MRRWYSAVLLGLIASAEASAADSGGDLADKAYAILKERCARCHGQSAKQAGLDVLSRENLIAERGEVGAKFRFVTPGNAAKSQMVDAIDGGDDSYMPQSGSPESKAMTLAEKSLLKEWVTAGAPFPKRAERPFLSEKQVLTAIRTHLSASKTDDRRYQRYYTLTHVMNNDGVTESDLRNYRAALAKVVNSLSLQREIHLPQPLPETNESVYVVDLRKLGWDRRDLWGEILKHYPYGLKYNFVRDVEVQEAAKDIALFSHSDLPYLRADWFIVIASQPPLYHTMLNIPGTLGELEKYLQLDLQKNFMRGDLQRSGYAKSGVSKQNRLLERHTSPATPYFWISYDFLPRRARGDLVRFPLGPPYPDNPFKNQAFEHDGGEIIWSLPNGLQGYMLVNAKGNRINEGPIDVVFDRQAVLGAPSIVNGVSCMVCHRHGMIREFRDEIRNADAVGGQAAKKVQELHPTHEVMQQLTRQDADLFLRALEKTTGPYLKVGDDAKRPITEFPEPVGKVAEMYSRDLTPRELAFELGIPKFELLQAKIESNRELLRFGLGAMIQEPPGTLKREKWESRDGTSLMQDVAAELRMGTPVIP